jgi:uncharacterized protein
MLLIAAVAGCSSNHKRDDAPAAPPTPQPPAAAAAKSTMPKVHLQAPQGDVAVEVEIVSTQAQIERGLMYREHLPPDQGMLFLMPEEREWSFWMRNTLIPLDLLFIASDMTIAGIVERAEPRTETLRTVGKSSRFVLEVNGGFCATHKIAAGMKAQFEGVPR